MLGKDQQESEYICKRKQFHPILWMFFVKCILYKYTSMAYILIILTRWWLTKSHCITWNINLSKSLVLNILVKAIIVDPIKRFDKCFFFEKDYHFYKKLKMWILICLRPLVSQQRHCSKWLVSIILTLQNKIRCEKITNAINFLSIMYIECIVGHDEETSLPST